VMTIGVQVIDSVMTLLGQLPYLGPNFSCTCSCYSLLALGCNILEPK
jgi:hypothetical protein